MRNIRRPRALLAVLAAGLLLAGCGTGPSQVDSAAIVGGSSISLGEVQQEIQWLLNNVPDAKAAQQQRKLDLSARKIVQGRVLHELMNVASQREGLRGDEAKVSELITSAGGPERAALANGVEPERLHDVASDQVKLAELASKYLTRLSVTVVGAEIRAEQPGATAKDQAMDLGRKLAADPANAEQIVQAAGQELINQPLPLAQALQAENSPLPTSALFGTRAGTVVVIQLGGEQTSWLAMLIKDRNTGVTTQQPPPAVSQANEQTLTQVGVRLLQPIANELGVKINPRYGVWDEAGMAIAANENELTGVLLPTRAVQP